MKNYNSVENCQREKLQFCGELSAKTIISGEIIIIRTQTKGSYRVENHRITLLRITSDSNSINSSLIHY